MNSYKMLGNRLYMLSYNGLYKRVKQKLPESISCISELEKYDYQYSINPDKQEYYSKNQLLNYKNRIEYNQKIDCKFDN